MSATDLSKQYTDDAEELVNIAGHLREVKHWAAQASVRQLAEMAKRFLAKAAPSGHVDLPPLPISEYDYEVYGEHGQVTSHDAYTADQMRAYALAALTAAGAA